MNVLDHERLIAERGKRLCDANGYACYVTAPNGRDACLTKLAFTTAILADLTEWGYGDRWCYETTEKALLALNEWYLRGLEGEPEGWHRHPPTGRRRENGDKSKELVQW